MGKRKMMKVSLISTVKNEEKSLKLFLDSIIKQTRKPDEIIIVDGGSGDDTPRILNSYKYKIKNLRVIIKSGNRSVGRNTAIKNASHDVVAVTDAGCVLDKHWLENIIKPFDNPQVNAVGGFYKPLTKGVFEKSLASYTCVMEDRLDVKNFLPSSRSIAFRKSAWKKAKGYPEHLETCEDLVFDKQLISAGYKFQTQKSAYVWWPQKDNIFKAAKQFFLYARGDGNARYFRATSPFLFFRYVIGALFVYYIYISHNYSLIPLLFLFLLLYSLWAIFKNYKYVKNIKAFLYLPLLQFVSDISVISGTILGLGDSIWDTKNK